ncbi:MAG TPA: succinate dehydrogenase assembly factor 2 [Porticoccaceae bacterium]|nr:succinate dehydrogenase assembly factor 2 [Porticoccaceae bacterium]HCO58862.1 succinate dehydrogenase assembly factor 2 [Porticoccaceae bacterium]
MDDKRLLWASRRGMLELDLILIPFVEQAYPQLAPEDQRLYQDLLACEDQDIFTWLLRSVLPEEEDMRRIVDIILASRKP